VRLLAALWLDRDGRPTLEALGHVGSAASVLPLKEAAQGTRGRLVNVALEAIAQIRSRLTGADPGQLSLAAGSDGQLALTDDEKGRVTLPEPPDPP
jgi:HEAT repeat protein